MMAFLQHSRSQRLSHGEINNDDMDHNLQEVLLPITVLGTLGASIIIFTRVFTDYILRKKMIDKGFVNDDSQAIFKTYTSNEQLNKYGPLKWGLVAFFGGLSLILLEYIDFGPESPLPYGLFTLFVSFGFLLYYLIIRKDLQK
jgi:hypothetical protein